MSDKFYPLSLHQLLSLILHQYDQSGFILGIPEELFFQPNTNDPFRMSRYGKLLESPLGVAAGPHTQLSQNIIAAWLTGARFIELKTIQTLDELDISKPCIDMQDEGYNCEWSQELKIRDSFNQYLDAWILIHILKDMLKIGDPKTPGFIFNMSVGYNLEGILKENVQWFFNKMGDASIELQEKIDSIRHLYPNIDNLDISPLISDNVTLSTMHGCPPEEIEKIGEYLIGERHLHTAIKLNPTLLGQEKLTEIFRNNGFDTIIPDIAFAHDLKYPDAIKIIRNLSSLSKKHKVHFGLKLTNTLESKNHKSVFGSNQEMMYMSGRALHPLSVNLAAKLQQDFNGTLDISFSGGGDAFNAVNIFNSGLAPLTVCTDLLKPGGYMRLNQYIKNLREGHIESGESDESVYLKRYAAHVLDYEQYRKTYLRDPSIKTGKKLGFFDCIHAPCETTCPTNQDIPSYLYYASVGDFATAADVVTQTNPFPITTGMVCDHLCQTKCTRINYDSPLLIREVKRVIAENNTQHQAAKLTNRLPGLSPSVAIVGAGPSGLTCAYFLRKAGFEVSIFETKEKSGGMVAGAIPAFRLTQEAYQKDLKTILQLGVKIRYNTIVNKSLFEKLRSENDFVYIAAGAQISKPFNIQGHRSNGIIDPLEFLLGTKSGKTSKIGKNVVIIGGGNTAMDAARTAWRLVGKSGSVSIAYRRSVKDMPADLGEIKAVLEEGVNMLEHVAPIRINAITGNVKSVTFIRMKPGEKDASGRARPVEIPGSEFELEVDTVIPAIGQELAIDFIEAAQKPDKAGFYETSLPGVLIGGDALRGASTAINAIGDGRKAAQHIINKAGFNYQTKPKVQRPESNLKEHIISRAKRIKPESVREIEVNERRNFNLVQSPLSMNESISEAKRCLQCDEFCSVCTTVCPNLALYTYIISPLRMMSQKITVAEGKATITSNGIFEATQKYQILHLADWCNQCGNCNTFCPTSGAPYLDKPHVYFHKASFENEKAGFYLNGEMLEAWIDERYFSFTQSTDGYKVECKECRLSLDKKLKVLDVELLKTENNEIDLKALPYMKLVYDGILNLSLT